MYKKKFKLHDREKQHRPGNLRTIAFDVTSKCSMKCSKCYAETFVSEQPVELPVVARVMDEAYRLGCFHYVLQGGEAIDDLPRLEFYLSHCHPDSTFINLVSNGWSMDKEMIQWLKDRQVDKITFSMDSGLESEHDSDRLPGSFKRVLQAVDHVIEAELLTGVSIVVTHQSLYEEGFKKAYEFALEKKIRLDVQIAEPVGNWDGRKDLLITPEDAAFIDALRKRSPLLPNGQEMIKRDLFTSSAHRCPAGDDFIGISASGEVLPCNFLQYTLGNIRDRSLAKMRRDILTNNWFNGDHERCIIGEDPKFFDHYVTPYVGHNKPLDAYQVFNLKDDRDHDK